MTIPIARILCITFICGYYVFMMQYTGTLFIIKEIVNKFRIIIYLPTKIGILSV